MNVKDQNLVSLAELAAAFNYTRDHLAYLCRSREIVGVKMGRSWMSSFEAVRDYNRATDERMKQRWEEMSQRQSLKAYIVPENELWDRFSLRAGNLGTEMARAIKDLALAPLYAIFYALNALARFLASINELPAKIVRVYEFATLPVPAIYNRFEGSLSVYEVLRESQFSRKLLVYGLSAFAMLSFAYSAANFSGVPVNARFMHEISQISLPQISMPQSIDIALAAGGMAERLGITAADFESVFETFGDSRTQPQQNENREFDSIAVKAFDESHFFCYNVFTKLQKSSVLETKIQLKWQDERNQQFGRHLMSL